MRKQIAAVAFFASLAGQAQRLAAPARFEVASVHRAAPQGGPGDIPRNMDRSPGHFAMRNVPLRFALEWAYDVKDYEIDGPEWIKNEERYDIVATALGPATDDQMKPMLQTLLTERFQLKLHLETRELPVYALIPGKGPAKVKPPSPEGESTLSGGQAAVLFHKFPLSRLTFLLLRRMDRPVLDLTGLTGIYDYTIDLSGLNSFNPQPPDSTAPSIFTSIQTDLGLKLEPRKAPIQILVIDSANKVPTETSAPSCIISLSWSRQP